jgi:hypothetical protein
MSEQSFVLNMAQPNYHPMWQDFYLQIIGDTLFANNIPPRGTNHYWVIQSLPVGQWFTPQDRGGQPVPVSLFVTQAGEIHGAWQIPGAG